MARKRAEWPGEDLQNFWRPYPAFVGPLMPPMLLWFARGRPKSPWELIGEERAITRGGVQLDLFAAQFVSAFMESAQ